MAGLAAGGVQTLLSADSIDGAGGSNQLIATLNQNVSPAQIRNVQTVEVSAVTNAIVSNLQGSTGVTTLKNSGSSQNMTFNGIATTTAIQQLNTGNNLTVNFNNATGTTDAVSLTLAGNTAGTITIDAVETFNIATSGTTAQTVAVLQGTTANAFNFSGTSAVTVTADLAALITAVGVTTGQTMAGGMTLSFLAGAVTAAGGSGNDTFTMSAAGAAGNVSLTGGDGNDTFVFAAANFTNADTVAGGTGTNTLTVLSADAVGYAAPATATVTGVGNLTISDALGGNLTTANISSGITTLTLNAAIAAARQVTAPSGTFTVTNDANSGLAAGAGSNLTVVSTGTGTADVLNITNSATQAVSLFANNNDLVATGYETVNFNTGSSTVIGAQAVRAVTLAPSGAATSTVAFTGVNGVTTAGAITANTITAAGFTGSAALTMGAAAASVTAITGSSNADTLLGDASSSIDGGAGNDTITGGTGNDTLVGSAGNDVLTVNTGNDSVSGGEGDDNVVFADAITANDTVDGGTGSNRITFVGNVGNGLTAAAVARVSNIQNLTQSTDAGGASTWTLSNFPTTITSANYGTGVVAASNTGNLTIQNASSAFTTFVIDQNNAAGGTLTFGRLVDTAADTLALTINQDLLTAARAVTQFVANGEETINLSTGTTANANAAFFTTITDLQGTALTSLVLSGVNNFSAATISNATALATINASGLTGTLNLGSVAQASTANLTFTGGSGASTVVSGTGNDTLTGGGAADSLSGANGNDSLSGGDGNDTLVGGAGADAIVGGAGTNTYSAVGTNGIADGGAINSTGQVINLTANAVTAANVVAALTGANGAAQNTIAGTLASVAANTAAYTFALATGGAGGSANIDTLSSITNVIGSAGRDYILASNTAATITAGNGADVITGGTAADTLTQTNTSSVAWTGEGLTEAGIFAGETVTFANGVDVVTNFATASDFVDATTAANLTVLAAGAAINALAVGSNYGIRGAFNSATGVFTQANAGADMLLAVDLANATLTNAANNASFIVLVGGGAATAANIV